MAPELLAVGANFNAHLDGLVPLHWACAQGKAGLVKHMLVHGADVQDADEVGHTPLTMALASGSFQVVMLVIDQLKALAYVGIYLLSGALGTLAALSINRAMEIRD